MTSSALAGGAAFAAAVLNSLARARRDERLESWTKPLTTLCLLGLALSLPAAVDSGRFWFALALIACLAGDVLLLPRWERFVAGLGAFVVAHVLFSVGALSLGFRTPRLAGLGAVSFAVAMGLVGAPILLGAHQRSARLHRPVTTYLVVIGILVTTCWATGRPWAVLGSTLFAASDAVLGWNRFVRPLRWASVTIMVTYHAALAALVLSLRS